MKTKNFNELSQSKWRFGSLLMVVSLFLTVFYACQKTDISGSKDNVIVPVNFKFETTHSLNLTLKVKDVDNVSVMGVIWSIYYSNPIDSTGTVSYSAKIVSTFITDYIGQANTILEIPDHVSQIFLVTSYPGYPSPLVFDVNSTSINYTVYPAGHPGNQLKSATAEIEDFKASVLFDNVYAMSSIGSQGIPTFKEPTRDKISQEFKNNVNASLPEKIHLPVSANKGFLDDATKANIQLIDKCEVWITFVTEGAGYRNVLGYYYYPTDNPPKTAAEIKKRIIVFPNTSLSGSGGGLVEGDKVKLKYYDENAKVWGDAFPANYTISWFMMPDGFSNPSGKGVIAEKYPTLYSIAPFNSPTFLQQSVILYDEKEQKMLIGFEDTQRNAKGTAGDEDFNDAVFYATANPIEAINIDHFNKIVVPIDTDKDGVYDASDEYPNDPKRAFKSYYPAKDTWGTLAYEDKWPERGDYDFNDVVVDYNTTIVKNASGLVVDVNTNYRFRAAGASYQNAFAVQFETPAANIESVTGASLAGGLFNVDANGAELDQTKAVIPVTDNINALFGGKTMVNTVLTNPKVGYVTLPVNVTFKTAIALSTLGGAPYNPFIVVDKMRGTEVHLPGKQPTDLVDMKLLGTGLDLTNFDKNLFYVANQSYPWALHIPTLFEYPVEQSAIDDVFYNFGKWVTSGGALYPAWYQNNASNADQTKIYK